MATKIITDINELSAYSGGILLYDSAAIRETSLESDEVYNLKDYYIKYMYPNRDTIDKRGLYLFIPCVRNDGYYQDDKYYQLVEYKNIFDVSNTKYVDIYFEGLNIGITKVNNRNKAIPYKLVRTGSSFYYSSTLYGEYTLSNMIISGIAVLGTSATTYNNFVYDNTRDTIVLLNMADVTSEMKESVLGFYFNNIPWIVHNFTSLSWLQRAEINVNKYSHFGLSMIKDNFINNGEYRTTTASSDFAKLFSSSSIQNVIKGMNVGDEKVLSYVGNKLADISLPQRTLSLKFDSLDASTNVATVSLRFYIDRNEQTDLRQTYTYYKTAENVINQYIAFYVDEPNEVARPTIIRANLGFYTYNEEMISATQMTDYYNWLSGGYLIDDPTIDDPFYWGGSSESSGDNTGSFDDESDEITGGTVPTSDIIPDGFTTIYAPTKAQLTDLNEVLWDNTLLNYLKQRWANVNDAIISLKYIPYKIPDTSRAPVAVKVGTHNTGLTFDKVSSQFFVIDCGEIDLKGYYGSYLDFSPLTKIQLFLPYISVIDLDPDEVTNHVLRVKYNIDIYTGTCVAIVLVDEEPRYQYSGNISYSMPITKGEYSSFYSSLISSALQVGTGIAMGNPLMLDFALINSANAVVGSKPNISVSGGVSANNGFMGVQIPYLIITLPSQCVATNQSSYTGYPLHVERALSDLTGYTEVERIHLENMTCTDEELTEIEELLKSGVIF